MKTITKKNFLRVVLCAVLVLSLGAGCNNDEKKKAEDAKKAAEESKKKEQGAQTAEAQLQEAQQENAKLKREKQELQTQLTTVQGATDSDSKTKQDLNKKLEEKDKQITASDAKVAQLQAQLKDANKGKTDAKNDTNKKADVAMTPERQKKVDAIAQGMQDLTADDLVTKVDNPDADISAAAISALKQKALNGSDDQKASAAQALQDLVKNSPEFDGHNGLDKKSTYDLKDFIDKNHLQVTTQPPAGDKKAETPPQQPKPDGKTPTEPQKQAEKKESAYFPNTLGAIERLPAGGMEPPVVLQNEIPAGLKADKDYCSGPGLCYREYVLPSGSRVRVEDKHGK